MKGLLAILFLAAQAQAATLYVSLTGSHDTNAPAFSTWEAAATNIQSAIDAASAGDTVRVAPGTYPAAVTINKNSLTVQGGNGTLWDADRTFIDRQGAAHSVGVTFSGATNSTLRGFTVMGSKDYGIRSLTNGLNTIDSCVIRGNVAIIPVDTSGSFISNCIVVGNTGLTPGTYRATIKFAREVHSSIVEANDSNNSTPFSLRDVSLIRNSIYVNSYGCGGSGGNITNATFTTSGTGSVCQLYNIARASSGSGSNLQWAGVAAYIPRIGSLAQGAGVGYIGIDAAKSGDGGPALWPIGAKFLGRDSSTNLNHGIPVGGVTASTNSPFPGGGSAAFDGAIYTEVWFGERQSLNVVSNFTIEVWVAKASNVFERFLSNSSRAGAVAYEISSNFSNPNQWRLILNESAVLVGDIAYAPWVHIAVSRSGSQVVMYQNGSPIATATYATAISGHGAVSTRRQNPGTYGNVGFTVSPLSDLRIWNVARTPEEIAANYTNRLVGNEAGLVGYWRLDEPEIPVTTGPFNLRNPTLQPTFMEAF